MIKKFLILTFAILALSSCASLKTGLVAKHPKWEKGFGVQGMDIYKNTLVQGHNQGILSIYRFDGKSITPISEFPLESTHKHNHCNVVSFGPDFGAAGDPLPLIYISQCSKTKIEQQKDVCYVERIAPDLKSSKRIQTIAYDDIHGDFGYALQWVVDVKNRMLYGYGNTTYDKDVAGNRHRIIKFPLPALDKDYVILTPDDALENYCIEDYGFSFATIGQGLYILGDRLYMPTGFGTTAHPARLYVWNLKTKHMDKAIENLGDYTTGEPEDLGYYKGRLIMTGIDGIFILPKLCTF